MEEKNNFQNLEKIYVAGFPKSGNTWLTRLLSDILISPAGDGMHGKDKPDIASDLNEVILKEANNCPQFRILKTHFRPEKMLTLDPNIKRVVYIKRDFRDVVISAFFHENMKVQENDLKYKQFDKLSLKSFPGIVFYYLNRFKLYSHLKRISKRWGTGDSVGSWGEHIEAWQELAENNKNILFSSVKYEDLLADTRKNILQIIDDLKIPKPSGDRLDQSIDRQSFKNKKKHFEQLKNDDKILRGREFNYKFIRKGVAGDWRHFFSKRMSRILNKHQGRYLLKNGFESDSFWFEKL